MKVLINRTDAIGDTLLSTPLARLIKLHDPSSEVAFLVSPRSGDFIKLCEGVDKVFVINPKGSFLKKWSELSQIFDEFSPDTFFHMGGDFTPSAMAFMRRVPFRGGLVSKLPSFLYLNRGVRQSRSQVEKHEGRYNMDLVGPLNQEWIPSEDFIESHKLELRPFLNLDKNLREELKSEEPLLQLDKKIVMIHPGMSGHTLNWPPHFYGELASRLIQEHGKEVQVVVTFTPSDSIYVEKLKVGLSEGDEERVTFYDGSKKGLIAFAHFMSFADLFIAPSTGTTHMANAMGVSQVALYSPIKVQSEKRWGPFCKDEKVKVFSPLSENVLKYGNEASMETISVDEVYESCLELLNVTT